MLHADAIQTFESLTEKQIETLELLADGRTGKEIAARLDVSPSAIVQRIEAVRAKFDGASRNELARMYRDYKQLTGEEACNEFTGNSFQLPDTALDPDEEDRVHPRSDLAFADSVTTLTEAPWQKRIEPRVVPEVLDGEGAVTFRWVYMVGAALGTAMLLLVLLAVSSAIGEMF